MSELQEYVGSGIHFWKPGSIGDLKVLDNCVLETAGDVVEVGEGVKNVAVGDRVTIEPGVPCGSCFVRSQGDYNLCEDVQFIGVYPYHGYMQRHILLIIQGTFYRLTDNMTYSQGLVEPISVAYHGIESANLKLGEGVFNCWSWV